MKHLSGVNRARWAGAVAAGIVILSLFAPAALHPAYAQPAQQIPVVAFVTAPTLSVRTGPGAGYDRIGTVSSGEMVTLLGRDSAASWAKIQTASDLIGWVSTYYLRFTTSVYDLPVVAAYNPQASVQAGGLSVRSGPGFAFPVIATLANGEIVNLLGRDSTSQWLYIRAAGGYRGWIASGEVTTTVQISSLQIETVTVTTPSATPVVSTPTPNPGGAAIGPFSPFDPLAIVQTTTLNVRTGPGGGYPLVTQVHQGDVMKMLGRDSMSSWLEVMLASGQEGWVSSYYVTTTTSVLDLPVTVEYQASGLIIVGWANVRSGPGLWFSVVTVAPNGKYVTLTGRTEDYAWLKVKIDGQEGWVASSLIETAFPLKDLPAFKLTSQGIEPVE